MLMLPTTTAIASSPTSVWVFCCSERTYNGVQWCPSLQGSYTTGSLSYRTEILLVASACFLLGQEEAILNLESDRMPSFAPFAPFAPIVRLQLCKNGLQLSVYGMDERQMIAEDCRLIDYRLCCQ